MSNLCIAACEYPLQRFANLEAWRARLETLCRQAAEAGAGLLVFPEYAGMELTGLLSDEKCMDLNASITAIQPMREAYLRAHTDIAQSLCVSILAGTLPWIVDDGTCRNRAWLCTPDGHSVPQDKIMMTRFECEHWNICGGNELRVIQIPGAKIGILTCYDVEFPLLARQLVAGGAEILLVPSCTDTDAGYHRVMLSSRARALEQQCFVIQSPLSGAAPWSPAVDVNTGKAGVFTPVDRGFPDDGIMACGAAAHTPWLLAELDPPRLSTVRRHGQVRNFRDWPAQESARLVDQ